MKFAAFISGTGTNLQALLDAQYGGPWDQSPFTIEKVLASRPCGGVSVALSRRIETNIRKFPRVEEAKRESVRKQYDEETLEWLAKDPPDAIVFAGYMLIATPALVNSYPIINVHPGDLTTLGTDGNPLYAGANAVMKAIIRGEQHTRSTIHIVKEEVDKGPILLQSDELNIDYSSDKELLHKILATISPEVSRLQTSTQFNAYLRRLKRDKRDLYDHIRRFAKKHQEKMKTACDHPALVTAVTLFSQGDIELKEGALYCHGDALPFAGVNMNRKPSSVNFEIVDWVRKNV